jgi:uncharacterized metal-binding protein
MAHCFILQAARSIVPLPYQKLVFGKPDDLCSGSSHCGRLTLSLNLDLAKRKLHLSMYYNSVCKKVDGFENAASSSKKAISGSSAR